MPILLLAMVTAAAADAGPPLSNTYAYMNLTRFDPVSQPLARCMDGTMSGLYALPAPAGSEQSEWWVLYLASGGWCSDLASCGARCNHGCDGPAGSKGCTNCTGGLGSSNPWGPQVLQTGIFDTSPLHAPLSAANKFFLPYCTSDGHMGSRAPSSETFGWQFRGQHTVRAALEVMVKRHGLGSKPGHRLLFGGGSAGSRGGMATLDYVGPMLAELGAVGVTVLGFLDSAYWIDIRPDAGATPPSTFAGVGNLTRAAFALANITGRAPPDCRAAYPGAEEWKCALGQYRFPFLKVRYMAVASQDDAWQLAENIGHAPKTAGTCVR